MGNLRDPECQLCPLHEAADYVCMVGKGTRKAKIMVIGEAPSEDDEYRESAFSDSIGKAFQDQLRKSGLDLKDIYFTYAVKCRPEDDETPIRSHIKACRVYLEEEIDRIQPEFILTLGNTALLSVTKKSGITKHRGNTYEAYGATVFASLHPGAIARNPKFKNQFHADIKRFVRLVKGEDSKVKTKTSIIRTKPQLKALIRYLSEAKVIAYDIETTGLQEYREFSKIVSISFTCKEGRSFVVPLWHKSTPWKDPQKVLQLLKPALERDDCKYVAHNGKFDCRWLARFGVYIPQTFDTMLAAHLLDENQLKGLKPLSQIMLGADAYDIGDDVKDAFNVDLKKLCIYNGKDTDYTFRLYKIFKQQLREQPRLKKIFLELMMPASRVFTKVEGVGIWVDPEKHAKSLGMSRKGQRICEEGMAKYQTQPVNINSPKQVAEWLFNELELPILEETAKGAPSTKESVLLQLAKQHPVARSILSWRKWNKYESTFLVPWEINKDRKGRLHPSYLLHGTVTGRLSCKEPNLQQVPRDKVIRGVLGAPPGKFIVEADYSQIELRIAAMLSEDPVMMSSFITGEDLHMKTAMMMTGKDSEHVEAEERKKAKAVNFGFLYGMGAGKFVEYARDNYDVVVSLEEAEKIRDNFFKTYRRLKPWHDRQRRIAKNNLQVSSRIGRIRHLPDILSQEKGVRAEAERQAINSPVQGLASDLMLMSLIEIDKAFGKEVTIIGSVHDAILMEIDKKAIKTAIPRVKQIMENPRTEELFGATMTVPIEVEIKICEHWGEPLKVIG